MAGWILKQPVDLVYILYVCKGGGDIAGSLKPLFREGAPPPPWKAEQRIIPAPTTRKCRQTNFSQIHEGGEATEQASPLFK